MRQHLFPFMTDHVKPISLQHAVYASCCVISRQLLRDLHVGSPEWILASEMGIIRGSVLPSNPWDAAGAMIEAATR